MQRFFPFLQWLPDYRRSWITKDLAAGLTVAMLLVPQGMAYALIADLPPIYGLYAALVPLLVYALLGTSNRLAVGPTAIDSLLVAASLGTLALTGMENYIAMAFLLAFMVGSIQLLLGFLRMGFLVNFLSKPVINGFTSAAAVIIIISQMKHLLGVEVSSGGQLYKSVINLTQAVPDTNPIALGIGIAGIVSLGLIKKLHTGIPGILIVVVIGILAVYFFGLQRQGISIIGEVPGGLPSFTWPEFSWPKVKKLFFMALVIALIGYTEAISIAKAIQRKEEPDTLDPNQELVALGSANLIGSLFQSYLASASFSRSAINRASGARTPLASIISASLVALTLLFFTQLFFYLPNSILASIIVVSVVGLIDISYPRALWKYRKDEFLVLLVTFFCCLLAGLPEGILTGVLLSLLLMVYRTSKPHFAVLGNIVGSDYYKNINRFADDIELRPDLLIFRFDSQLYFGNISYFKKQLFRCIAGEGRVLKGVILNAEAINYIDSTAVEVLANTIHELQGRGIKFYIAGANGPTRDIIFNSRIIEELPSAHLFGRTKDAVDCFDNPDTIAKIGDKVAHESRYQG